MKKILWIGSFITGEALVEARKRGYGNPASVQSQKNLVEGLEEAYELKFDTIGALVLHAYPFVKTKVFKEIDFSHISGAQDCVVKFYNFTYINKVSSQINLCKKVEKWAKGHKNDDVEVFVYEMRSACINAAISLKRIIPSAKIHLIIPDIPAFMDLRMGRIKRIMKKIDYFNMKSNFSRIDDFIVYSETMIDYLDIRNRNWVVMEGSIDSSEIKDLSQEYEKNNRFIVMYSGHVEERFGIRNLVDAFRYLPEEYELRITGRGNAAKYVEEKEKMDKRIHYYGFLPDRQELLRLQSEADVFVNMRDPDELASHYCFPSKLFEYMLTGKIVLTCKLKGIPEEYYRHLKIMKSINPEEVAEAIKEIAQIPMADRLKMGIKAKEYIAENKNNKVQALKIKSFLDKLYL